MFVFILFILCISGKPTVEGARGEWMNSSMREARDLN